MRQETKAGIREDWLIGLCMCTRIERKTRSGETYNKRFLLSLAVSQ
jgi:hypothetical protein